MTRTYRLWTTVIAVTALVAFAGPGVGPALAKAHKRNAGKTMTDQQAIEFVESKRRKLALRRAKPYLEGRS